VLELILYTIGAYVLLGLLMFTAMLEIKNVKLNKLAKKSSKGWSLNERD
jgi:hypothetical protein